MVSTLIATALLCLISYGFLRVIPYFARARLLTAFLPQDIRDAARDHPDPPPGKRMIGYGLTFLMAAVYVGMILYVGADGLRSGAGFWQLFGRYMLFLYGYKVFDILVQDQYLVITRQYFVSFYPETEDCRSWHDRSFNTKNQLIRLALFPFAAAMLAAAACWLGR